MNEAEKGASDAGLGVTAYLMGFRWLFLLLMTTLIVESLEGVIVTVTHGEGLFRSCVSLRDVLCTRVLCLALFVPVLCTYATRYFLTTPWKIYAEMDEIQGEKHERKRVGSAALVISAVYLVVEFGVFFIAAKSIGKLGFILVLVLFLPVLDLALPAFLCVIAGVAIIVILVSMCVFAAFVCAVWLVLTILVAPVDMVHRASGSGDGRRRAFVVLLRGLSEKVLDTCLDVLKKGVSKMNEELLKPVARSIKPFLPWEGPKYLLWNFLDLAIPLVVLIGLNRFYFSIEVPKITGVFSRANLSMIVDWLSRDDGELLTLWTLIIGVALSSLINILGNWSYYRKFVGRLIEAGRNHVTMVFEEV